MTLTASHNSRHQVFWEHYANLTTGSYRNAYKAALASGFTEHTARNITRKVWFKKSLAQLNREHRKVERKHFLKIVERNRAYLDAHYEELISR